MLHLHLSNRTENLYQALSEVIATPIQDVFQPEVIVVEELGMARWLSQKIAEEQGIAANIEFPLPAGFVWKLLHAQLQQGTAEAGFSKSTLIWYAMALLPRLKDEEGFESINRYLTASDEETKTYQLSRQVADLFDQYLVYRPEMLLEWEAGKGEGWQAELWRAMREISAESHWAGLLNEFKQSIVDVGFKGTSLPERVSLFALSSLSPGYIELLALVAEHIDIHLYIVNPSYAYWGDIVSEKDLAKLRAQWQRSGRVDISDLYMVGNPLLASMGQPCRDFLDQWHDYAPQEHEDFEEPGDDSLLSMLQGDILNLQTRGDGEIPVQTIPLDDSLEIHACHSPMREVQVLHDRLLKLFDSRSDLKPHEIVVMAPDINRYAPYIEAVFGSVSAQRHIPYSVADQSISHQSIVETLLSWILLPEERFEAPTVMGWLEVPSVQARLRLDEEAIERIRQWVAQSGIRWGLDGAHKAEFGLPENEQNTWRFGFRRLFLGYAMTTETELFQSVAPFNDVEGGESVWLGQLQAFIEQLASLRQELSQPATLSQWQTRINRIIEQFFQPSEHEEILADSIREQVARMVGTAETAGFEGEISAQIMHQHLSAVLSAPGASYRLLSGRVTFCNMVPVRSIPFRVVCCLGMNDGDFPRNQRPLGFDLIAQHPRKGDRSLRSDDRYLFLESLLSAREALHISYVGRSQQDNSERLPSVVVTELLDYVEQGYEIEGENIRKALHVEHPLQPFSRRNFALGSYAREWLEREAELQGFTAEPLILSEDDGEQKLVTLDGLIKFLTNPSRHFLEYGLGIHSAEYSEALEECERFELDALSAYSIKRDLLDDLIQEGDTEEGFEVMSARGELPHGALGRESYEEVLEGLPELAEQVNESLDGSEQAVDIDLEINGLTLTGWLQDVINDGVLRYRPAKIKDKDRLSLWVEHLALCASGTCGQSRHLGIDNNLVLKPVESEVATAHLEILLALYQEGVSRPIPILMNSSMAYATSFVKKGDEKLALSAARKKWESTEYFTGDGGDPWIGQAFRDIDPYGEEFELRAKDILVPMIRYAG